MVVNHRSGGASIDLAGRLGIDDDGAFIAFSGSRGSDDELTWLTSAAVDDHQAIAGALNLVMRFLADNWNHKPDQELDGEDDDEDDDGEGDD